LVLLLLLLLLLLALPAQTSMVQRMWETWAPKALEGSPAEAGNTGGSGRLSGGLGIFKRPSRASSNLAEQQSQQQSQQQQQQQQQQSQAAGGVSTASLPVTDGPVSVLQLDPQDALQRPGEQPLQGVDGGQALPAQQHPTAGHASHSIHGPSRLRPGTDAQQAAAACEVPGGWQANPEMRPLRSYKGSSEGGLASNLLAGPDGLRDISVTSNASYYSVDDEPPASSSAAADWPPARGAVRQQQQAGEQQQPMPAVQQPGQQQQQHQQGLRQRGKSEVLMRAPSPPAQGQGVGTQANVNRQQRWSDPASWPSRPRTPSPLPMLSGAGRPSHAGSRAAGGSSSSGGDGIVSAFAAIAAAAEPFDAGRAPRLGAHPSTGSSLAATGELLSDSSAGSELDAAVVAASIPADSSTADDDGASSQGGAARVNVTIGGGVIPGAAADSKLQAQLQPLLMQPPSRTGSGRRSALFEEVALRRWGRVWILHSCVCLAFWFRGPPGHTPRLQKQLLRLCASHVSASDSSWCWCSKAELTDHLGLTCVTTSAAAVAYTWMSCRSGDMSSELRLTISHLVQVDSSTLLAAYYASPIPQPGETYRLMLGDLYRLEFERCLPLQQYAPPGRSKLRHEVLTYAEVECAQQLQLWTVAALCRCGSAGLLLLGMSSGRMQATSNSVSPSV
jgi:hypothetical protein